MSRIIKRMTIAEANKCLDWADNNGVDYYIYEYGDENGMSEFWMEKWPEWINV